MARGNSGRVVIEIDPALKRRLYAALAADCFTLKNWFIDTAKDYLSEREQPSFPDVVKHDRKKNQS